MAKITRLVRGLVVACCAVLGLSAGAATYPYSVTNQEYDHNQANYAKAVTLTLPAVTGAPAGTEVSVSEIVIGTAGDQNGNKYPRFIEINDVKSAQGTTPERIASIDDNGTKFTFEGLTLEVGTSYAVKFYDEDGETVLTALRFRLAAKSAGSIAPFAIDGVSAWSPLCLITGTFKAEFPTYNATVTADGITWDVEPPATLAADSILNYTGAGAIGNLTVPAGVTANMDGDFSVTLTNNGTVNILSGVCEVTKNGDESVKGTVNIAKNATFRNLSDDAIGYRAPTIINVRGTLDMGTSRWTVGSTSQINCFGGCTVTAAETNNRAIDLYRSGEVITVNKVSDEPTTVSLPAISPRNDNSTIKIASGMTVTFQKPIAKSSTNDGLINITGGGKLGGTVEMKTVAINLGSANGQTAKFVAVEGTNTLKLEGGYGNSVASDSKAQPFITVNDGATLNLAYNNFAGWNGDLDNGYIVNNGTLKITNLSNSSGFFRNHLVLGDGVTTELNNTYSSMILYGGAATEETAQIQLASGTAAITSAVENAKGISLSNDYNEGGFGTKGAGIAVGNGATLTIYSLFKGSETLTKWGQGTLVLANAENTFSGSVMLKAGALTVSEKLADGKVTTDVTSARIDWNETTKTYTLVEQVTFMIPVLEHAKAQYQYANGEWIDAPASEGEYYSIPVDKSRYFKFQYVADENYTITGSQSAYFYSSGLSRDTTYDNPKTGLRVTPVAPATPVAKIGETTYTDLHEALVAAQKGQTVELVGNVDLAGVAWEPVAGFVATFDGMGHTISNLSVNVASGNGGLFATFGNNAMVRNFTIENVSVSAPAGRAGAVAASMGGNCVVSNVTVSGSIQIVGNEYVGALVGHGEYSDIADCHVDGVSAATSYVRAVAKVGGIWGMPAEDSAHAINCSVKNVTFEATSASDTKAGALMGRIHRGTVMVGCTAENCIVKGTQATIGGAIGRFESGANTIFVLNTTVTGVVLQDAAGNEITYKDFGDLTTQNVVVGTDAVGTFGFGAAMNLTAGTFTVYGDGLAGLTKQIAEGYEAVQGADGTYTIQVIPPPVAKIGETTYKTFEAAFSAAQSGDTITLLTSAETALAVTNEVPLVLDLGGYTLSRAEASSGAMISANNTLSITNGSISGGSQTIVDVLASGNVTLDDIIITGTKNGMLQVSSGEMTIGSNAVVSANADLLYVKGKLNVYGTLTRGSGERPLMWVYGGAGCELNVYDGASLTSSGADVVRSNGGSPVINIYGGTLSSVGYPVFYSYGSAKTVYNVYDGKLKSASNGIFQIAGDKQATVTPLGESCKAAFGTIAKGWNEFPLDHYLAAGYELVKGEDNYYTIQKSGFMIKIVNAGAKGSATLDKEQYKAGDAYTLTLSDIAEGYQAYVFTNGVNVTSGLVDGAFAGVAGSEDDVISVAYAKTDAWFTQPFVKNAAYVGKCYHSSPLADVALTPDGASIVAGLDTYNYFSQEGMNDGVYQLNVEAFTSYVGNYFGTPENYYLANKNKGYLSGNYEGVRAVIPLTGGIVIGPQQGALGDGVHTHGDNIVLPAGGAWGGIDENGDVKAEDGRYFLDLPENDLNNGSVGSFGTYGLQWLVAGIQSTDGEYAYVALHARNEITKAKIGQDAVTGRLTLKKTGTFWRTWDVAGANNAHNATALAIFNNGVKDVVYASLADGRLVALDEEKMSGNTYANAKAALEGEPATVADHAMVELADLSSYGAIRSMKVTGVAAGTPHLVVQIDSKKTLVFALAADGTLLATTPIAEVSAVAGGAVKEFQSVTVTDDELTLVGNYYDSGYYLATMIARPEYVVVRTTYSTYENGIDMSFPYGEATGDITFPALPGKKIAGVKVNGVAQTVTNPSSFVYTSDALTQNVYIEVSLEDILVNVVFMNGTAEYLSTNVVYNTTVSRPTDPTAEDGFVFKGWTNATYTAGFDFSTQITTELTLNAWFGEAGQTDWPAEWPEADAAVKAKFAAWQTAYGATSFAGKEAAFLLNVDPAAVPAFKIESIAVADGVATVVVGAGTADLSAANGVLYVEASNDLTTWTASEIDLAATFTAGKATFTVESGKFMKAKLGFMAPAAK